MTDAFAGLVDPIFHHVVDLRAAFRRGEHPSTEAVKRGLLKAFQDAQARTPDARAADFALAKFALVYWADEVLIHSEWSYADHWKDNILELDYWGTRFAGVDFWRRAKEAEARAQGAGRLPRSTDPLEVYFLCVAMGFRGELFQDESRLEAWAVHVGPIIRAGAPEPPPPPMTAQIGGGLGELRGDRILMLVSWLVSATAVLTLLGFIAAVRDRGDN
jgi:type VI secretion system protein ImpK